MNLLQEIFLLQEEKRKRRIVPNHILFTELKNRVGKDISEELNRLWKEGKIGVTKTINQKAVYLLNPFLAHPEGV